MLNRRGFTLIELLVTVGILGILLGMAGLQGRDWMVRTRVQEQMKQFHTDLANTRLRASNRGRTHFVRMDPNWYEIWEDTDPDPDGNGTLEPSDTLVDNRRVVLKDPLLSAATFNAFTFDNKGLVSGLGGTIRIENRFGSSIDCIVVSSMRIRMGRLIGANCI